MHITWHGTTAIKLQAKPDSEDITVLIDPYKPNSGNFPRNLIAHLVLYTRGKKKLNYSNG